MSAPWKKKPLKPRTGIVNYLDSQSLEYRLDWLIDWFIYLMIDWLIYLFNYRLIDWLIDELMDWLIDWSIDWLIDWSIDWLIDWSIDWLIDWLTDEKCFRAIESIRMRCFKTIFRVASERWVDGREKDDYGVAGFPLVQGVHLVRRVWPAAV